ncbi:MAG: translation initiation factor IF-3 [Xanthomonadales bacterium PRO6]|nr:translation initiation factor IF-3 [Xanthomonadales bacterium PRO6]
MAVLERPTRKNDEIRVPQLRVIGPDGEQVGILSRFEAMRMAQDAGLDLVEIVPNADPPVCRIMDFGKYKFELQKKANLAKKKQKQIEIKEMKFRPGTDDGDFNVKMRAIRRFLEEGDKVKINLRFRGRELAHIDLGDAMLNRIAGELAEDAVIEQRSRVEGRVMSMMISPKKKLQA